MRKRRLRLAFTCFAALMLLAQLALTAGHLHIPGPPVDVVATVAAGTADLPAHPIDQDDDHCAFCWAQAAAGTLLVPPVLTLPLPAALSSRPPAFASQHLTERAARAAFRPRAPPSLGG
jgi:hypothetical protein